MTRIRASALGGLSLGFLALLSAGPVVGRALPRREPAETAKACPEMGEGFVRLDGSPTCVKVGGSVRVEVMRQGGSGDR